MVSAACATASSYWIVGLTTPSGAVAPGSVAPSATVGAVPATISRPATRVTTRARPEPAERAVGWRKDIDTRDLIGVSERPHPRLARLDSLPLDGPGQGWYGAVWCGPVRSPPSVVADGLRSDAQWSAKALRVCWAPDFVSLPQTLNDTDPACPVDLSRIEAL